MGLYTLAYTGSQIDTKLGYVDQDVRDTVSSPSFNNLTIGGTITQENNNDDKIILEAANLGTGEDNYIRFRADGNELFRLGTDGNTTVNTTTFDLLDASSSELLHITQAGVVNISGLTASRLISTDASKNLVSIDLDDWIAGTTNEITVTDEGDGTITLSLPSNIYLGASGKIGRDADNLIDFSTDNQIVVTVNENDTIKIDSSNITYIGNEGTTNYTQIAADGEITLVGTAKVIKSIILKNGDLAYGATPPTSGQVGANQVFNYTISDNSYISLKVPEDWDSSTTMSVKIRWAINEAYATNSGEIQWQIEVYGEAVGEVLNSADYYTAVNAGDINIPATANTIVETTLGTIAPTAGDTIGFLLTREAIDDGNNPSGAEPYIISIEVEYTSNKLGTAT